MKSFTFNNKVYTIREVTPHLSNMGSHWFITDSNGIEFSLIQWNDSFYGNDYEIFNRDLMNDARRFETNREVMEFLDTFVPEEIDYSWME